MTVNCYPIEICPKDKYTRWVALDDNNNIIAEGRTPSEVIEKAKKITDHYFLMFIPQIGIPHIFLQQNFKQ